jgi:hypothetical protein
MALGGRGGHGAGEVPACAGHGVLREDRVSRCGSRGQGAGLAPESLVGCPVSTAFVVPPGGGERVVKVQVAREVSQPGVVGAGFGIPVEVEEEVLLAHAAFLPCRQPGVGVDSLQGVGCALPVGDLAVAHSRPPGWPVAAWPR